MNHVLYSLIAGHRLRRVLGGLLCQASRQGTRDVDLVALKTSGIAALVFDFDGVLAPHGEMMPLPETQQVLLEALEVFGAGHVYILSNKPSPERLAYFQQQFSGISFISGVRKKPYPDGLLKVSSAGPYAPDQIALLDDRLLTGGLACVHAGAKFIYISKPYISFSRHPFKESFFACLRLFEVVLARLAA
jgi:predicted HAD superfamily phosphohydrolase YqeG